jgi:hypothetical protein
MTEDHKARIHALIQQCADEMLTFIVGTERSYPERWVPAIDVKEALKLNFVAVPSAGVQRGEKGWLFAILARILEDQGRLEYKRVGSRSYCRSKY